MPNAGGYQHELKSQSALGLVPANTSFEEMYLHMIRIFQVASWFFVLSALTACQAPGKLWVATTSKDQFTDVETKMLTVGSITYAGQAVTQVGKLYPFVGTKSGVTYVGLRSGGNYRLPTGTVQIRVDENQAWTITPEETPVDLVPGVVSASVSKEMSASMMESMSKIMSPYTAATGDKAKKIIAEIVVGKTIRYRSVGLNQPGSTTGETQVDESFRQGIVELGISVN